MEYQNTFQNMSLKIRKFHFTDFLRFFFKFFFMWLQHFNFIKSTQSEYQILDLYLKGGSGLSGRKNSIFLEQLHDKLAPLL